MKSTSLLGLTLCVLLSSPALGQSSGVQGSVCVFHGPGGGIGSVVSVHEQTGAVSPSLPQLTGIQLISVDVAQRSHLTELLPSTARFALDDWNVSHVVLPKNLGSVYHYRRQDAKTPVFGYFLVQPNGAIQVLLERPELPGGLTPFAQKIGVAPDGQALLIATKLAAGGDLLEVALDGSVQNRTQFAPPLRIGTDSLHLGPYFGAVVTGRGFVRFARTAGAQAQLVQLAGGEIQPVYFNALASSINGEWCVGVAGADSSTAYPFVFGATGPARRASTTPSVFAGAGFLPETPSGPYLAVSDDGTQALWRATVTTPLKTTGEALLGRVAQAVAPQLLSGDANILDTLDEVGLFGFRVGGVALYAVGERAFGHAGVTLDKADLFLATTTSTGTQLTNLSATSGDTTVPFTALPQWDLQELHMLPDGSGWLIEQDGVTPSIEHLSTTGVRTTLVSGVRRVQQMNQIGSHMLVVVQKQGPQRPVDLHCLTFGAAPASQMLQSSSEDTIYSNLSNRQDGWASWSTAGANLPTMVQRLQLGGVSPLSNLDLGNQSVRSGLDWTSAGSTVYSTGNGVTNGSLQLWLMGQSQPTTLGTITGPLHILPANS